MSEQTTQRSKGLLDPIERLSEVLFGLIMVLSFTGSLSAATAGREEVRTMLFGAIGCNLAWGIVDAVMYLITRLTERGRDILTLCAMRQAADPTEAHRIIADALPVVVSSVMRAPDLEALRARLIQLPEPADRPRLDKDDFFGAVGVFFLVFLSTFPVAIPFVFMRNAMLAVRISNGVAIAMLFLVGYFLGRRAGHRPWQMGLAMVLVGSTLVGITIVLGG